MYIKIKNVKIFIIILKLINLLLKIDSVLIDW